jgi:outer membrane lipoprotein-sorting protein
MGAALNRKIAILSSLLLLPLTASAQSQAYVSADKFFADLSSSYTKVKDYEANLVITRGKATESGKLSYKTPFFLNIKFDSPADQVINFDGKKLTVYNPSDEVVLEQNYKDRSPAEIEGMVSAQSLLLLQRNYSVAYLTGPAPVPLEDGSREMVVKLKLQARGSTSYSQYILSVNPDLMLIRRMEGTLVSGDKVVMDFTGIKINQGLPDSRFDYKAPPYANVQPDWLFDPSQ